MRKARCRVYTQRITKLIDKLKNVYKSRMMWAAFFFAVFNAACLGWPLVAKFVAPALAAWIGFAFAIIVAALRYVTTQPLEAK
jgi:NADH:ubiquinone oxidoreductase subunit 4 (subunit M)